MKTIRIIQAAFVRIAILSLVTLTLTSCLTSCKCPKKPTPESLFVAPSKLDMMIGDKAPLHTSGQETGVAVAWTSSNPDVAVVNNNTVVAIAEGSTVITGSTEVNSKTISGTCQVTVKGKRS